MAGSLLLTYCRCQFIASSTVGSRVALSSAASHKTGLAGRVLACGLFTPVQPMAGLRDTEQWIICESIVVAYMPLRALNFACEMLRNNTIYYISVLICNCGL